MKPDDRRVKAPPGTARIGPPTTGMPLGFSGVGRASPGNETGCFLPQWGTVARASLSVLLYGGIGSRSWVSAGSAMNVLIVEDNRVARKSLEASLVEWGYDVITCSNGTDALRLLTERDPPGLAILDWMIPGMDGIEVCRKVRESGATPFVYILIVTGKGKSADVVAALEAGADDYLTKPFDASELRVRMRAGERIVRLQQELRFKADHDALTGLWNHKTIIDFLGRELSRAQREGTSVAVFVVDLDHFKQINDTYGHLVGDEVLREAVGRDGSLHASLRSDRPLRWGRVSGRASRQRCRAT